MTWDYTAYPPGHFDAIWASPCCTHYSCARRGAKTHRNLVWADSLVLRMLEIIECFQPRTWFIENPQTGMLKDRSFMEGRLYTGLDYCCYCIWGYRMRARLWTNVNFIGKLPPPRSGQPSERGKRQTQNDSSTRQKHAKQGCAERTTPSDFHTQPFSDFVTIYLFIAVLYSIRPVLGGFFRRG